MPQLVPFYFINQVTFVLVTTLVLLYILSTYILPKLLSLFTTRVSIVKL